MFELKREFPDPDVLLALSVEELACRVLFILKARVSERSFHPRNVVLELNSHPGSGPLYETRVDELKVALSEALAWLQSECLLVPQPESTNGWVILSRRAKAMATPTDFADHRLATSLPKELLHPSIREAVWLLFARGDFQTAVFQAMRQVEIAIREASDGDREHSGVKQARRAFDPTSGPLTDMSAEAGEREGMGHLVAGALAVLKNPHSHDVVDYGDASDPVAVVLFASLLLRMVEARKLARSGEGTR